MKKWQDAIIFSFFPSVAAARKAVANVRMSYWLRHPSTSPIEKRPPVNVRLNCRMRNPSTLPIEKKPPVNDLTVFNDKIVLPVYKNVLTAAQSPSWYYTRNDSEQSRPKIRMGRTRHTHQH